MRRAPECRPCVLGDLDGALVLLGAPPDQRAVVVAEGTAEFDATWPQNRIPGEHICDAHRLLKRALNMPHPFEEARSRANAVGIQIAKEIAARAPAGDVDRLRWFARWAIAGNLLDFRICGYDLDAARIEKLLHECFDEGLAIDELTAFAERLPAAREIVVIHDNVGEIAFDKELLRELGRQAPNARITSALKGGVMTSDATVDDGRTVGLGEVAEIIASGPDTLGICIAEMSGELRDALARADLVISKGQGNFYVLEERPREVPAPTLLLLRTKCMVTSRHLGFDHIVNVARFLA
jgi:damage-control phosphatase, subfamily I